MFDVSKTDLESASLLRDPVFQTLGKRLRHMNSAPGVSSFLFMKERECRSRLPARKASDGRSGPSLSSGKSRSM